MEHRSEQDDSHADLRGWVIWLGIPLAGLILSTLVCRFTTLDVSLSHFFYDGDHWPYLDVQPWISIYRYGVVPGLVMGGGGLLLILVGLWTRQQATWGKLGLFLVLLFVLAPGLLVNGILKPGWHRPRPNQIRQFGGDREFVQVGTISAGENQKSFPSGHASMGFFLIAPAFFLWRRHRSWALAFAVLGLVAGGMLGMTRIVQGRHFLSDVIWSAAIVYFTGLSLSVWLGFHRLVDVDELDESVDTLVLDFAAERAGRERNEEDDSLRRAA